MAALHFLQKEMSEMFCYVSCRKTLVVEVPNGSAQREGIQELVPSKPRSKSVLGPLPAAGRKRGG